MVRPSIVCVLLLSLLLVGCATANLPSNPTPEQRNEALCRDARIAYNLSIVMLEKNVISPQARAYWEAYKAGAALAIESYCFSSPVGPPAAK